MRTMMKALGIACAIVTLIIASIAPVAIAARGATGSDINKLLAQARQATTKYHDVNVALADGYAPLSGHVPGMGAHYVNFALFFLDDFDHTQPEILLYSLTEGNKPKLVAVEYGVFGPVPPEGFPGTSDVWDVHEASCHYPDGYEEPQPAPELCPLESPGSAPLAEWHPDISALHAWIWRGNPDGVFAPFNPNVP